MLRFARRRHLDCWRFGDDRNGSFRRLDGHPFEIRGELVKALAETAGPAWHQLIGLDDVVRYDRRDVLLIIEGSKDAMAALHFAKQEGRLSSIGLIAALGASVE